MSMNYKGEKFESTKKERLIGAIISTTIFVTILSAFYGFIWGFALDKALIKTFLYTGLGVWIILIIFYLFIFFSNRHKDSFLITSKFLGILMSISLVLSIFGAFITWLIRTVF